MNKVTRKAAANRGSGMNITETQRKSAYKTKEALCFARLPQKGKEALCFCAVPTQQIGA